MRAEFNFREKIRTVSNFPKDGVNFLDISPILSHPSYFQNLLEKMAEKISWEEIDVVIGIESRGFLLASALAAKMQKGLVLCRKAGKLPPPVVKKSYALEYGNATIEMNPGKGRALILDDVLATGGTLQAAINISSDAGYQVKDVMVLIDIQFLNEFKFNNQKIKSILQYS